MQHDMSQDEGHTSGGYEKDPGINRQEDAPHRDPTLFPLDVHAPTQGGGPRPRPQVTPSRPAQTTKRPPRPVRPQQPPRPPVAPAPVLAPKKQKNQGCGCFSWAIVLLMVLAFTGYLGPIVSNTVDLINRQFLTKTPEQEFDSFKNDHWVVNVQPNPRSDPSGFRSLVIIGPTGREKRNFFLEKGVRYKPSDPQSSRGERAASERIYLRLDDRRYEGFLEEDSNRMVAVAEWNTGSLLRVRPSDISFYRETEVTYIENDLASFLQRTPKTLFIPKRFLAVLEKGGTAEGIDIRYLNETDERVEPVETKKTDTLEESETVARYPGGRKAWDEYIDLELRRTQRRLQREGRYGNVYLSFLVDEQGFVSEVKALPCKTVTAPDCLGPETYAATMLVEAVQRSPRWLPAKRNGIPVGYTRRERIEIKP